MPSMSIWARLIWFSLASRVEKNWVITWKWKFWEYCHKSLPPCLLPGPHLCCVLCLPTFTTAGLADHSYSSPNPPRVHRPYPLSSVPFTILGPAILLFLLSYPFLLLLNHSHQHVNMLERLLFFSCSFHDKNSGIQLPIIHVIIESSNSLRPCSSSFNFIRHGRGEIFVFLVLNKSVYLAWYTSPIPHHFLYLSFRKSTHLGFPLLHRPSFEIFLAVSSSFLCIKAILFFCLYWVCSSSQMVLYNMYTLMVYRF